MNHHRLIGGLGLALMLASRALAADPGDAAEGKRLALQTCTACHRVAADQAREPTLKPPAPNFLSVANGAGLTDGGVYDFLRSNHKSRQTPPDMPTMILSEGEAMDLTAYIVSLRKTP